MRYHFDAFGYCPVCGQAYDRDSFDPATVMLLCGLCRFEFYQHSVPSASAIVPDARHPGRILLITRRTPPNAGLLALPGGILRHAEDPSAAALRETLEETTVMPTIDRLLCATRVNYLYLGENISMLELAFLMRPIAVDLTKVRTPEATRLEFLDVDALLHTSGMLAFPEQASVLTAYQQTLRTSFVH